MISIHIFDIHTFDRLRPVGCALLVSVLAALIQLSAAPQASLSTNENSVVLLGHLPPSLIDATPIRRVDATEPVPLALTLCLRHQAQLQDLLTHLYTPGDPAYGHYLTPQQF